MAASTGVKTGWRSGVYCKCGENLFTYPVFINEYKAVYNFMCKNCNITGRWDELARSRSEAKYRSSSKKKMADR